MHNIFDDERQVDEVDEGQMTADRGEVDEVDEVVIDE
jgi:predicted transcriptional regulator